MYTLGHQNELRIRSRLLNIMCSNNPHSLQKLCQT